MGVMLADLHTNGKWQKEKDRLKSTDKGEARSAQQNLRTQASMPSGPITDAESRLVRTFSTLSGEKDTNSS